VIEAGTTATETELTTVLTHSEAAIVTTAVLGTETITLIGTLFGTFDQLTMTAEGDE
jgi:hypothetical protein